MIIRSAADLELLQPGEVLVTEMTDPDWEPVMKRAAAVVTDRGGRTCHAAIVSRELGIPAIVGTGTGTSSVTTGEEVTVSCAEGEEGFVYRGRLPVRVERTNLADLPSPRTPIMMNVARSSRRRRTRCSGSAAHHGITSRASWSRKGSRASR